MDALLTITDTHGTELCIVASEHQIADPDFPFVLMTSAIFQGLDLEHVQDTRVELGNWIHPH